MKTIPGADLRAEREAAGIHAAAVALMWQVDPATISRLEGSPGVDSRTARRYRRAIAALAAMKRGVRRELIRELAGR